MVRCREGNITQIWSLESNVPFWNCRGRSCEFWGVFVSLRSLHYIFCVGSRVETWIISISTPLRCLNDEVEVKKYTSLGFPGMTEVKFIPTAWSKCKLVIALAQRRSLLEEGCYFKCVNTTAIHLSRIKVVRLPTFLGVLRATDNYPYVGSSSPASSVPSP